MESEKSDSEAVKPEAECKCTPKNNQYHDSDKSDNEKNKILDPEKDKDSFMDVEIDLEKVDSSFDGIHFLKPSYKEKDGIENCEKNDKESLTTELKNDTKEDISINLDINREKVIDTDVDIKVPRKRGRKKKIVETLNPGENTNENQILETKNDVNEDISLDSDVNSENTSDTATVSSRPGRKKRIEIYNEDDDPDTIKEKKKKRSVELKLNKLKSTFNETQEVSGKRLKRAPQRFELAPTEKRRTKFEDDKGIGEYLCDIRWINHQLRAASLDTLRHLHRVIYRKQGMFAEKQIIKNVMKFNGFPFDANHPELTRRRGQLEKLNANALKQMCEVLGIRPGNHDEMVENIITFLLCPSQKQIESYITEVMDAKLQQAKLPQKSFETSYHKPEPTRYMPVTLQEDLDFPVFPIFNNPTSKVDLSEQWKKPSFFFEGNGVKLKYIRAVIANIEAASEAFVELLHRLLYLNVDEKAKMRRNILEFSGIECEMGTTNYIYRIKILSVLPMEQLKLICRVLCLPTWHRSRQYLTDGIMDFLSAPRISAMKKRVPPVFSDEISFSFDTAKGNQVKLPELKHDETEEIEIIPDIHIPDETSSHLETDFHMENEYLGVKLKNFSNIYYQVIGTSTAKLSDVHMVLYLTTSPQHSIRKKILEFSGFNFEENSAEYICRRTLMEQMHLEELKGVATVLCVSQYICDDSKKSLIDAILKFLLKPSALLSSSTIMPTISQSPVITTNPVVKKKATSTSAATKTPMPAQMKPDIVISSVGLASNYKDAKALINAMSISSSGSYQQESKLEIEKVKASLSSSSIEITPVPTVTDKNILPASKDISFKSVKQSRLIKMEKSNEGKSVEVEASLASVKKEVIPSVQYYGSDDDDDIPLSKMIGHPNDDQLKALVLKIIKESKLEEITMKHVIRKVFEAYPNYDLNYRKEFIKSNVRLILSQMDDQSCSVSTTVINI